MTTIFFSILKVINVFRTRFIEKSVDYNPFGAHIVSLPVSW